MPVKSDWGGWLVLTSVVVFPSMLYLKQPLAIDVQEKLEHSVADKNYPQVSLQLNRKLSAGQSFVDVEQLENNRDRALELEPGLTKESGLEEYDSGMQKSFFDTDSNDNPIVSGRSGGALSKPDFVANNYVQEETGDVSAVVSVGTSAETVVLAESDTSSDNTNLYLAESEYVEPFDENRCPPVYMELNDYARNMREAMGCDNE